MDIETLELILLMLLVGVALALGGFILLQQGKGADVGAAFGSGSSNTMFGSAGSTNFLTKATAWLAIGFFVICFALAFIAKERAGLASNVGVPQVEAGIPLEDTDAVPATGLEDEIPELGDDVVEESDIPDV